MRFGPVPVSDLAGAVLAHTHRLPRPGAKALVLKKGRVLDARDAEAFGAAGFHEVIVAVLEPGDVGEDAAAERLAAASLGPGLRLGPATTGRVNVFATGAGLLQVDAAAVDRVNAVHEALTVATLPPRSRVRAGDLVATVKVIPFAVPLAVLERALAAATPAVALRPFLPKAAGLVLTRLPGFPESLLDRASQSQRERLARLGGRVKRELRTEHDEASVAAAAAELLADGCDPVLLLGASAIVDREDVFPRAVRRLEGEVVHLGMPVDPGNLLLLARAAGADVVGVPGCARSLKPSGFDEVLARLATGERMGAGDVMAMGAGGLLKEVMARPAPRRGGAQLPANLEGEPARVGAVVLAAGRSSRMGAANKLLAPVDGEAMVRGAVRTVQAAGVAPVVVVTGHEAEALRAALEDFEVELVHNERFAEGMGTSLAAGIRALERRVDAAFVCLGDMPRLRARHLEALRAAYAPREGALLVVPVHGEGKLEERGHPVLFDQRFFPALASLEGDRGARRLLDEHADVALRVPMDDAVLLDVDTPEGLAALRASGAGPAPEH
ncbi:MAG: NTP transferase domain-containing protein [Myxococcota bacterium]